MFDNIFLAYGKHMEECEDIIQKIAEGETNIQLDDYFAESDLEYIRKNLLDRYSIVADLTIS